jgi:aminopeptidase-like protein
VDSSLEPGSLTYGELILPGRSPKEILLSTYICHPSMANNEVSGPVVTTFLAKWLQEIDWRYTFRIVFIPETIGSIVYLSRNLEQMRSQTIAGYVITCVGDDRAYSYLPSRQGDTLSDQVALHVLSRTAPDFKRYSFLDRGSDERQYCSPGADLPVASIMRSKYAEYPEYHTSLDDMSLISPEGLGGAYEVLKECLSIISGNYRYRNVMPCEPQLGKRGLYPTLSTRETKAQTREMMDLLAYSDGRHLMDIAETIGVPASRCIPLAEKLTEHGLLKRSGDDE